MPHPNNRHRHSDQFLAREPDGSVRVRVRWLKPEVSLVEEAAGREKVIDYVRRTIIESARRDVAAVRADRAAMPPPEPAPPSGDVG